MPEVVVVGDQPEPEGEGTQAAVQAAVAEVKAEQAEEKATEAELQAGMVEVGLQALASRVDQLEQALADHCSSDAAFEARVEAHMAEPEQEVKQEEGVTEVVPPAESAPPVEEEPAAERSAGFLI